VNIVVDTNIVFSAIIYDKGKIGELLLNKPGGIHFLSPDFLLEELNNHTQKLLSLTGYSEIEYQQIKAFVTKNIEFIDSTKINKDCWHTSYQILKDIDEKDTSFLALNLELKGVLWTGDKKLIKGLQNKNTIISSLQICYMLNILKYD
jgi:predicted nucleic acid-binding protein